MSDDERTQGIPYRPQTQPIPQHPTYTGAIVPPPAYPVQHRPDPAAYPPPPPYGATVIGRPAPSAALIIVAWTIAVLTCFYMLPWAVAATRGKSNQLAIALINFLLGWSFIGWVVSLVMACGAEPAPVVVVNQYGAPPPYRR